MKTPLSLPHKYKKIGWVLALPSFAIGLLGITGVLENAKFGVESILPKQLHWGFGLFEQDIFWDIYLTKSQQFALLSGY